MTDDKKSDIRSEDKESDHICDICRSFIKGCGSGQLLLNINQNEIQSIEMRQHKRIKKI